MPSLLHKSSRRDSQLIMSRDKFSLHSKLHDLFNLQREDKIRKRNLIGFSMGLTYSFDVSEEGFPRIPACGVVKVLFYFMQLILL
jgi:hypothetical protein